MRAAFQVAQQAARTTELTAVAVETAKRAAEVVAEVSETKLARLRAEWSARESVDGSGEDSSGREGSSAGDVSTDHGGTAPLSRRAPCGRVVVVV